MAVRFETLIENHHDEIYRYLWRLLPTAADAEDITQEVFMKAYQHFKRLRPNSNHRAWLYKIATNSAYTFLKRQRIHAPLKEYPDNNQSPHQQLVHKETMASVHEAIAELPMKQQAALVLRYLHELSYTDIAEALDCSEDSARANVYQAMRRLRHDLQEELM